MSVPLVVDRYLLRFVLMALNFEEMRVRFESAAFKLEVICLRVIPRTAPRPRNTAIRGLMVFVLSAFKFHIHHNDFIR